MKNFLVPCPTTLQVFTAANHTLRPEKNFFANKFFQYAAEIIICKNGSNAVPYILGFFIKTLERYKLQGYLISKLSPFYANLITFFSILDRLQQQCINFFNLKVYRTIKKIIK